MLSSLDPQSSCRNLPLGLGIIGGFSLGAVERIERGASALIRREIFLIYIVDHILRGSPKLGEAVLGWVEYLDLSFGLVQTV